MKIEIYVVKTEIQPTNPLKRLQCFKENKKRLQALTTIKTEFIKEYFGLSESQIFKGFWINENKLYSDKVQIWQILTDNLSNEQLKRLNFLALQIRDLTKQKTQLYTINEKPIFV